MQLVLISGSINARLNRSSIQFLLIQSFETIETPNKNFRKHFC